MQPFHASLLILICIDLYSATELFEEKLFEKEIDMIVQQTKAMQNGTKGGPGFRTGTPKNKFSVFNQQFEPIRIRVEFDDESFIESGQSARLIKVVRDAAKFWEKKLKVRRINNAEGLKLSDKFIKVTKSCDVFVTVEKNLHFPTKVKNHQLKKPDQKCLTDNNTKGFQDTDLILFVTYELGKANKPGKPILCKAGKLAMTIILQRQDIEMEMRPVAGFVNICNSAASKDGEQLKRIMQHEIGHALGFKSMTFPFYRKKDDPLAFYDSKIKQYFEKMLQNGKETEEHKKAKAAMNKHQSQPQTPTFSIDGDKYYLATPKVKETARDFFDCPTLSGAPMHKKAKGEVGDGSSYGHFDELILTNDLMSAAISELTIPTPLTFSVFEDSGWYELTDDSDLDVDKFRNSPESANVAGLDEGCDSPDSSASLLTLATVMLVLWVTM